MYKEENKERKNRIKNIVGTAGLITAAAFGLRESGGLRKLSKFADDSTTALSKAFNEIREKKLRELDYNTIRQLGRTHFLDDNSTWKELRRTDKITLDYSSGLLSSVLQYSRLENNKTYLANEIYSARTKNKIFKEISENIEKQSSAFYSELTKTVDDMVENKNKYFAKTSQGLAIEHDEFIDRINKTILEKHANEIEPIIQRAINEAENRKLDFTAEFAGIKNQVMNKFSEELNNKYKSDNFFRDSLDRAATVNDLLTADRSRFKNSKLSEFDSNTDIFDILERLRNENQEFGNLVVDNALLRVDKNGDLYSTSGVNKIKNTLREEFADTVPGKLFMGRSFTDIKKAPDFLYIPQGSYDPIIGKLTGSKTGLLKNDIFKLGDKFYSFSNHELTYIPEADNLYLISGKHGNLNILNNRLQGNIRERITDNKFANRFDIGKSGTTKLDEIRGIFEKYDKDSDWIRMSAIRIFDRNRYEIINRESAIKFKKDINSISNLYNAHSFVPEKKTINALKQTLGDTAVNILDSLNSENPAETLLKNNSFNPINEELKVLLGKYKSDINSTKNITYIGDLGGKNGLNVLHFDDLLKREIVKEAILRDATDISLNYRNSLQQYSITKGRIDKTKLSGKERANINNLFNWSIIQHETNAFSNMRHEYTINEQNIANMKNFKNLLFGQSNNQQLNNLLENFGMDVSIFVKQNSSEFDSVLTNNKNFTNTYRSNEWVTMRKTINPLDIIKSINDDTFKDTIKSFGKQFFAGRDSTDNITTATLLNFHMVNRLSTPLQSVGLGFSSDNTKSFGNMALAFGLKRILPAIGIGYGLSYLNYESENITGTSMTQAMLNSSANFELGIKTISGAFGLDNKFRRSRMYNPIANYWLDEYRDKDEYLDYLENGYDPVRKGRWWNFGSASELRGGKISYFEPNKIRQSYSHYHDISVYGSVDEKWKHSFLPTPRHPLSTLRFLSNPYWLEEKHYYDRPYPVTGKLFDEGTPWGVILNPTIGRIIKPQRKMHVKELDGTLTDVKSIIYERNKAIFNRKNNRLIRISDSGFDNMSYKPYSMPSMNEAIYSLSINNGKLQYGYQGQLPEKNITSITDVSIDSANGIEGNIAIGKIVLASTNQDKYSNALSELLIDALSGSVTKNGVALSTINELNKIIKSGGIINEQANLWKNPYNNEAEKLQTAYLNQLKLNRHSEYISDALYSAKELSGMYGFLLESIFPSTKSYRLEHAGNMSSFSKRFWDENIGGTGGDFMEIARRFFPHSNHDIIDINPLRNTMPLWLPERFLTGDPYTKITKGEARLPGAGYESLNKLHPDQYGRYGAFDRFKILADVAPNTEEYKTWKKIAKQQIKNDSLIAEMEQIEKRVSRQSKNHDFYNYKFLGKNMINKNVIVESVSNKGEISVVGSNEKYVLAGITPMQDKETKEAYVHNYIKAGMQLQLQYENNIYNQRNKDGAISVIAKNNGDNINKKMWEDKTAKENFEKETLADELFAATDFNFAFGKLEEAIAHAPIPYIHNKFLRINSPLESYKDEQIYGSNYSTWEHPFKGFIQPTFQTAFSRGPLAQILGISTMALSNFAREEGWTGAKKFMAHASFAFTNPTALAGGIIGALPRMNWGSHASIWNAKNGANIGATIGLIGYGFANLNNPLLSVGNFGVAGSIIASQLKYTTKEGKLIGGKEGAIIGGMIGLGLSAIKNPDFNWHRMTGKYIPKDTEKKWEIEEYYDRLKYIKYTNLYHKAARLAKKKDGVDIDKILNKFEYNREHNKEAIKKLNKAREYASRYIVNETDRKNYINAINQRITALSTPEEFVESTPYVKAALAYKQAADSTIYGLKENSSETDIMRALNDSDKEYFAEFAKEKDPEKQKEILKYISPYKRKALEMLWGHKKYSVDSNVHFFSQHRLPGLFWSGWQSNVNLDNIKMKTIENEGMLLSQFGIYESQKDTQDYKEAEDIGNIHSTTSPLSVRKDLFALLNGLGLRDINISVESSPESGLQMITNISRLTEYNIKEKLNKLF